MFDQIQNDMKTALKNGERVKANTLRLLISKLKNKAIELYQKALKDDNNFLEGLNVYKGQVTHKAIADAFGHKYVSPSEALTN